MRKELLGIFCCILLSSNALALTFSQIESKNPKASMPEGVTAAPLYEFMTSLPGFGIKLSYLGKIEKFTNEERLFLESLKKSMGENNSDFFEAFTHAIATSDKEGKIRRLLMQKNLLNAFHNEVFQGGLADYQIRMLGYLNSAPVYAVVGFRVDFSRWQASKESLRSGCDSNIFSDCFILGTKIAKENPPEAVPIFDRACKSGHQTSCFELGKYYADTQDRVRARTYYEQACQSGQMPMACNNMATTLEDHQAELKKNLYQAACARGLNLACQNLGKLGLE